MKAQLIGLMICATAAAVMAQGTVEFTNLGGGVDWPLYESDGVTRLSGAQFEVEMLAGPAAATLQPVATASFLSGAAAGYFSAAPISLSAIPKGAAHGYRSTFGIPHPEQLFRKRLRPVWRTPGGSHRLLASSQEEEAPILRLQQLCLEFPTALFTSTPSLSRRRSFWE